MPAYRFDVAFSFAGPHREKVRAIAELVSEKLDPGIQDRSKGRVFFDEWFEHEILGSDMDALLQRIYHRKSLMIVADLSEDYQSRRWPRAEERAIRALRFELDTIRDETARLRLINARFSDGDLPDVLPNDGWYDAGNNSAPHAAEFLAKRLALLHERLGSGAADPPPLVPIPVAPPILFFHPATNDALYSRRERELDWLDACAKDPRIRIVTVTGVGGLGKTSLVGHWIEVRQGWQHRAFRGVFFYSFYSNRDPDAFFAAFLEFVCEREGIRLPGDNTPLHHLAAAAMKKWCYLVVLDGLEVLQHGEDDPHYGWINDGELTEFVARVGRAGQSLLVLTSRFPFPEVTRDHPEAARAQELPLLTDAEGADLLAKSGLTASREGLESYSHQFGGHPLALRIFAGACQAEWHADPAEVSEHVRSDHGTEALPDPNEPGLDDDERRRRKQRRQFYQLLRWFQEKLPAPKRRLLQLVALFREPVPTATLAALATGLDAMKADFLDCDPARIRSLLDALVREHLLQREDVPGSDTARWAAHPIVREVFRAEALKAGDTVAAQFAEIVAGKGEGGRPKSVAELQPILEAIEVLLAAGDFNAANELYLKRLSHGLLFQWIPAPQEGLRCARGFVEPEDRRAALASALGQDRLARYLRDVATYESLAGEMDGAKRRLREVMSLLGADDDGRKASAIFQDLADVQTLCGELREATGTASRALDCSHQADWDFPWFSAARNRGSQSGSEFSCLTCRAHAQALAGNLSAASEDFATGDAIMRKADFEHAAGYWVHNVRLGRHCLRLGDVQSARRWTQATQLHCQSYGANADIARCDLLLGELDLEAGDRDSAARRIGEAVRVFREARQGKDLPDALLAQARLRRSVEDCEEALRLAARSGFALKQCDALNLRALLRREAGEPGKAAEDAREALEIAERCGYYWGRHEALRQLRDAAKALGNRADEKHWEEAEQELSKRMQPLIKEALGIEHAHDREMEKLYGK
jgi:tetratricopeptide (TPR) repeat protein